MNLIEVVIASRLGYPHQESQVQQDGKAALVLVDGDKRQSLFCQKYNGHFRAMTDSLAQPSDKLGAVAVQTVWFDADKPNQLAALKELPADPDCVLLEAPMAVSARSPIEPTHSQAAPDKAMGIDVPTLDATRTKAAALTGITKTSLLTEHSLDAIAVKVVRHIKTEAGKG